MNLPIALAAGAAIAAAKGDPALAGVLWGAVEAAAGREPRATTTELGLDEYADYVERAQGEEFEAGRSQGRALSLEEAVQHALSALD